MADFYRIRRLPPYVFAEVNAGEGGGSGAGEHVVDPGMGNPNGAPPQHVIDKLGEVARNPRAHRSARKARGSTGSPWSRMSSAFVRRRGVRKFLAAG
jgi:alanine-synthesizing transaminase